MPSWLRRATPPDATTAFLRSYVTQYYEKAGVDYLYRSLEHLHEFTDTVRRICEQKLQIPSSELACIAQG